MTLQYDPEFLAEAGPKLKLMGSVPKPALHDVATRRAWTESLCSPLPPIPDNMERLIYHIPTEDGFQLPIHHFRLWNKPNLKGEPAILHIHGGGFISLTAEQLSPDHVGAVSRTGVQILTVDYRLAPEHPYPTPLSIDPTRIALMGESAGGGICAGLTIMAREKQLQPPIAKQILIYPMIDDRTRTNHAGKLAFWDEIDNETAWTAYLGEDMGTDRVDAYAAPVRVESVVGLPPLYLECGQLDLFLPEGMNYAFRFIKFIKANIPVEFHMYPGLPHGFEGLAPSISATKKCYANRDRAISKF
ncbi:uncharacterized protein N7483_008619 [Penicillium malachiteum]|uniref:uncharacterized protein n=1 Tax=Penicillium malachiteum TaxID=1324776 RepID=UPI0025491375|nr:uncharacterized protein N7483_008619 [Penicillium malachiteum]KAJ5720685.1 hypothetical protein N7483_008619 [Penicillium malachiteum]